MDLVLLLGRAAVIWLTFFGKFLGLVNGHFPALDISKYV